MSDPPVLSVGGRRILARAVLWPSWAATAGLTAWFAAGFGVPVALQVVPLAAGLVLFGLPHGALDLEVVERLLGPRGSPWGRTAALGLGYLALAGLVLAIWAVAPVVAFAGFILLTLLHWGQGDLYALLVFERAEHLPTVGHRAEAVVLRGALPMLVPLIAFPETYASVAESTIGLFRSGPWEPPAWPFAAPARWAIGAVVAVLLGKSVAGGWGARRAGARGSWLVDAAETLLLLGYFAVVPPVLAIGVYFGLWHGLRHVGRLAALDPAAALALDRGAPGQALVRLARRAAPATLAAAALIAAMGLLLPDRGGGVGALIGVYLVGLSALTLPHTLVVAWLDHRQGVWSMGGSALLRW